jgi:WD40 repeat protein
MDVEDGKDSSDSRLKMARSSASLSEVWEIKRSWEGAYTGGKTQLLVGGSVIACLCSGDVALLDLKSGALIAKLQAATPVRREREAGCVCRPCEKKTHTPAQEEERDTITCFAVHSDGRTIVTASSRMLLRHWVCADEQWASPEIRRSWRAHDTPVASMAWDPTGHLLATGSADRTVKVGSAAEEGRKERQRCSLTHARVSGVGRGARLRHT